MIKIKVFWDKAPCLLVTSYRRKLVNTLRMESLISSKTSIFIYRSDVSLRPTRMQSLSRVQLRHSIGSSCAQTVCLFLSAAFFRNNFRSDKRIDFTHVFIPEICTAKHADLYTYKLRTNACRYTYTCNLLTNAWRSMYLRFAHKCMYVYMF
jgi:hypothetical protein